MNIEGQIQKINELVQKGNKASYKLALDKIINLQKKIQPNSFVQNLTGLIVQRSGRMMDAIKYYENSHSIDSNNISPLNNLAYIYEKLKKWDLAKKYFDKVNQLDPNNLIYLINISNYYHSLNQLDKSTAVLKKAMKIAPKNINVLYNLARNYANEGSFEDSIKLIEKVIEINKHFSPAYVQLINLKKNIDKKTLDNFFQLLNDKDISVDQKADIYLAISYFYEKSGNDEKFFEFLNKANSIYRERIKFNRDKISKLNISLINSFKNEGFENKFNDYKEEKKIIFVCGLPRSGTTLIEQILSSHSKVNGQGELHYLSWGLANTYLKDGKFDKLKFQQSIKNNENLLADSYFQSLKHHEIKEEYVVDKMPANFQLMGLINSCFPKAKIILTNRNVKDVFFSIYKRNFTSEEMSWTFSEDDILYFYDQFKEITNFWKQQFGNSIYEINYENLISDNENEVKKLLDFCELGFEKECLDHSKNAKSKISTASLHQARQPIYKSSINNSKKYEKFLKKLFSKI